MAWLALPLFIQTLYAKSTVVVWRFIRWYPAFNMAENYSTGNRGAVSQEARRFACLRPVRGGSDGKGVALGPHSEE